MDGTASLQMAYLLAKLTHLERIRETEWLFAHRRANDAINSEAIRRAALIRADSQLEPKEDDS